MRVVDWVIAIALVLIGLSCLTMSANMTGNVNSFGPYLTTLWKICLWAGIPAILVALLYFLLIKRK
ncbi:hypothetical protein [Halalkalibacter urbisdiaboli]|uniref:hypothetical protein n=1 Tax=Halalkalibacter urbisdiaboli TaxID=1960589 RepID=UPI000B4341D9|nr:hypothetical protein [Halalkalibacter urbisdiaboli]